MRNKKKEILLSTSLFTICDNSLSFLISQKMVFWQVVEPAKNEKNESKIKVVIECADNRNKLDTKR